MYDGFDIHLRFPIRLHQCGILIDNLTHNYRCTPQSDGTNSRCLDAPIQFFHHGCDLRNRVAQVGERVWKIMRGEEVDMLQRLLLHVFETLVSALCLRDLAAQVVLMLITSMKEEHCSC